MRGKSKAATSLRHRLGQHFMFDVGALPYAFLTSQRTWRDHGARLATFAEAKPGEKLLDLGCGPGESAFGMAEQVPGLRVTGLDLSDTMIRIARARRARDSAGANVDLVRGDAMALPFADGTFDAAAGHSFLYLVPDAVEVLRETRRVLRPGRSCAFLEPRDTRTRVAFPPGLRAQALGNARFVASLLLWQIASGRYGRWDETRVVRAFEQAGLDPVRVQPTLEELGMFAVARRPPLRRLHDVEWDRWKPKDEATLLFVVKDGKALLIVKKRGLGAGKVNAPGGRLEASESPRACAIREVEEEVRVTPTGVEEVGRLRFQFADGYALACTVFRASDCVGTPTETDEATPFWAPLDALPYERMWADDRLWLPMMLAGERFAGRFVFDGDAMLGHAFDAPG